MTKTNSTWKKIKVQTLYKGIRMNWNMQEDSQDSRPAGEFRLWVTDDE